MLPANFGTQEAWPLWTLSNATIQFGNANDTRLNTHYTFVNVPLVMLDLAEVIVSGTGTVIFQQSLLLYSNSSIVNVTGQASLVIEAECLLNGQLLVDKNAVLEVGSTGGVRGSGVASIYGL